jgi:hypothetical protein
LYSWVTPLLVVEEGQGEELVLRPKRAPNRALLAVEEGRGRSYSPAALAAEG